MPFRVVNAATQEEALLQLAALAQRDQNRPLVRETAMAIARECASRDDDCELEAIFQTIKSGDSGVRGLRRGFKYISDPRDMDYFTAPFNSLKACARGACGGDCDDHASLICALGGALGFKMGLRAWGEIGEDFSHVYAVAGLSKRNPVRAVGMDTTVSESYVGWEPPRGRVMTAWLK